MIPYLFYWSQNFLGILLMLHMTRHSPMLGKIRESGCGQRFEEDLSISVELMIDWIRDLKTVDPIAKLCWKILQGVYNLD